MMRQRINLRLKITFWGWHDTATGSLCVATIERKAQHRRPRIKRACSDSPHLGGACAAREPLRRLHVPPHASWTKKLLILARDGETGCFGVMECWRCGVGYRDRARLQQRTGTCAWVPDRPRAHSSPPRATPGPPSTHGPPLTRTWTTSAGRATMPTSPIRPGNDFTAGNR
jgi:hypothetical protein